MQNQKKHFLKKQRPEAYNLSPSAQGAPDEEERHDSPKSVLHNISFVVRKVGMCSKGVA